MSDPIKHECGITLVRLLKPLSYYQEKYGSPLWGFFKLFLMLEKQHNRGQDGAGVAALKMDVPDGLPYLFRERNVKTNPLDKIFRGLLRQYEEKVAAGTIHPEFAETAKAHFDFAAECYLGHLRYGTSGGYNISSCHPYFRKSPWPTRNLMLAGNFNITNTQELNESLVAMGQHPIFATDTQALLEKIGFYLDEEHEDLYRELRAQKLPGREISHQISERLDVAKVLRRAAVKWDGGYTLVGMIGNGDSFVARDPSGIRPGFWFQDDEVVAFASERVALMTVFDKEQSEVSEIEPGHVVVVKKNGQVSSTKFKETMPKRPCSFERIYFSRGNDPEIYPERKALGAKLAPQVMKAIGGDFAHAVFGYVPNTAEVAYYGLMEALRVHRRDEVKRDILTAAKAGKLDEALIDSLILNNWPRAEKIAVKDVKIRTFIGQEKWRNQLASHVYDVSYGSVKRDDTLVCVDDSIVRGTTLRRSILRMLGRLQPKKIVIVSTAPQIRYPDCYGIDMSELGKFIAFEAAISLLKEHGQAAVIEEVYRACSEEVKKPAAEQENIVKRIYAPFTDEELSARIGQLVRPKNTGWHGELQIIFQNVENLRAALPNNNGDWYFTGNYPTPGGIRVANQAFLNYYEKAEGRSY